MTIVTPSSPVDHPAADVPVEMMDGTVVGVPGPASAADTVVDPAGDPVVDPAGDPTAVSAPLPGTGLAPSATGWDPLAALTAGTAEPAARFRYDIRSGDWWWSPGMFALHGFADGEVQPSTDLLMSRKHPDDLAATEQTLRSVLATGEPFCCRHRVVDAGGQVREVLSVGEAVCDDEGRISTLQGYFVDLTLAFATANERAAATALAIERRRPLVEPTIEQAKGVLIAAFRLTPDAALELLTWRAEETRTDLSVVARGLVAEFHSPHDDDLSAARRACAFLGLMALDED